MRVAVLGPLGLESRVREELVAAYGKEGMEIQWRETRPEHWEAVEAVGAAEAAVIDHLPFGRETIEALPTLRMLSVAFTGHDHVNSDVCRERGIVVANVPAYATEATAEMALLLMLGVLRKMIICNAVVRNGGGRGDIVGRELAGKTVGIIGLGRIGQRMAQLLAPFGCRLLGWNRTVRDLPGVELCELDALLEKSDIVTLHLPLNAETRLILNRERMLHMKQGAILVNAARGPLVDSAVLAEMLQIGHLAGAGVDVFEMEPPLPHDHPLLSAPNLLLSPHVGYATEEALATRARIALENVLAWSRGNPQNVVA